MALANDNRGTLSLRGWVALSIVVAFLLFTIQNAGTVDISFLIWRVTMSRVFLLIGSLAVGCLIGMLLGWEMFGRKPMQ